MLYMLKAYKHILTGLVAYTGAMVMHMAQFLALPQVKLPLEVGTYMACEWKQGQYHRAKIIERRKRSDAPDYEYYVHYIGCE